MKPKLTYCFDIDGTLCSNTEGSYELAQPDWARIARVNELFQEGNTIILFTARGSTTGIDWRDLTKSQLEEWSVSYHQLILGKPFADIYVDDKAVRDSNFF